MGRRELEQVGKASGYLVSRHLSQNQGDGVWAGTHESFISQCCTEYSIKP